MDEEQIIADLYVLMLWAFWTLLNKVDDLWFEMQLELHIISLLIIKVTLEIAILAIRCRIRFHVGVDWCKFRMYAIWITLKYKTLMMYYHLSLWLCIKWTHVGLWFYLKAMKLMPDPIFVMVYEWMHGPMQWGDGEPNLEPDDGSS